MLFAISQKDESLMMNFRAAYVVYQDDPCRQSVWHTQQVQRLIDDQTRLNDVSIRLQALAALTNGNQMPSEVFLAKLIDMVERMGTASPDVNGSVTALAIEANRSAAQQWISGVPPATAPPTSIADAYQPGPDHDSGGGE